MNSYVRHLLVLTVPLWAPQARAQPAPPDSTLPAGVAAGSSSNTPPELELTRAAFQNTLQHLTQGSWEAGALSGFHLYDCPPAERLQHGDGQTLCRLNARDWILVPTGMDPDRFHGGHVFRDGQDLGWKSFFPSGWTADLLLEYLRLAAGERLVLTPLGRSATLFKGELGLGSDGKPTSVLIYDASRRAIRTFHPDLPAMACSPGVFADLLNPHSLRAAEAVASGVDADTLLEVRQRVEALDFEGLEELRARSLAVPAALNELLKEGIRAFDADQVDLLLRWSGVLPDHGDLHLAVQKTSPARYRAQADILESLLWAKVRVEQALLIETLHAGNPDLAQVLVRWCLEHGLLRDDLDTRQETITRLCPALTGALHMAFKPQQPTSASAASSPSPQPLFPSASSVPAGASSIEAFISPHEVELALDTWIKNRELAPSPHVLAALFKADPAGQKLGFQLSCGGSAPHLGAFFAEHARRADRARLFQMLTAWLRSPNGLTDCIAWFQRFDTPEGTLLGHWVMDNVDSRNLADDQALALLQRFERLRGFRLASKDGEEKLSDRLRKRECAASLAYLKSLQKDQAAGSGAASSSASSAAAASETLTGYLSDLLSPKKNFGLTYFAKNEATIIEALKRLQARADLPDRPACLELSQALLKKIQQGKDKRALPQRLSSTLKTLNAWAAPRPVAASQGNGGVMVERGRGDLVNRVTARAQYRRAAGQGNLEAQVSYGSMLLFGEGGPIDRPAARTQFRLAADQGNPMAQHRYAYMLQHGLGGPQNLPAARALFALAAGQDYPEAKNDYGLMLMHGQGGPEDLPEARAQLARAAASGLANAQLSYAVMLEHGHGGPTDLPLARFQYQLAAAQGNPKAQRALGRLL